MHFIFLFSKFLFRLVQSYFEIPLKTQEIFMINNLKSLIYHMPSIFLHFPFKDRKKTPCGLQDICSSFSYNIQFELILLLSFYDWKQSCGTTFENSPEDHHNISVIICYNDIFWHPRKYTWFHKTHFSWGKTCFKVEQSFLLHSILWKHRPSV